MASVQPSQVRSENARRGTEIIEQRIQPALTPEDHLKFVAVDVDSEDYEIHRDDYTAVMTLRGRRPSAVIWLGRIGQPAAYSMRRSR